MSGRMGRALREGFPNMAALIPPVSLWRIIRGRGNQPGVLAVSSECRDLLDSPAKYIHSQLDVASTATENRMCREAVDPAIYRLEMERSADKHNDTSLTK